MWINGRRAFRPDAHYYRRSRRLGSRSGRRRRGALVWLAGVIAAIVMLILWGVW